MEYVGGFIQSLSRILEVMLCLLWPFFGDLDLPIAILDEKKGNLVQEKIGDIQKWQLIGDGLGGTSYHFSLLA